jgi:hypothetical protein
MKNFDYEKIKIDLRARNIGKFRKTSLYANVSLEQAKSVEQRYIEGEIELQEFTALIESIRRGIRH